TDYSILLLGHGLSVWFVLEYRVFNNHHWWIHGVRLRLWLKRRFWIGRILVVPDALGVEEVDVEPAHVGSVGAKLSRCHDADVVRRLSRCAERPGRSDTSEWRTKFAERFSRSHQVGRNRVGPELLLVLLRDFYLEVESV